MYFMCKAARKVWQRIIGGRSAGRTVVLRNALCDVRQQRVSQRPHPADLPRLLTHSELQRLVAKLSMLILSITSPPQAQKDYRSPAESRRGARTRCPRWPQPPDAETQVLSRARTDTTGMEQYTI